MTGDEIKRMMRERGLSQKALADYMGIQQSNVSKLLAGRHRMRADQLDVIKRFLDGAPKDVRAGSQQPNVRVEERVIDPPGRRDLPVYASAQGGPEGMMITYEPIDWIIRPAKLQNVDRAFAFYVVGDSMEPRFFQGERLLVHPGRPPTPGDDVLVIMANTDGATHSAMVKRLVRVRSEIVTLAQYNPPEEFELPSSQISDIFLIVGNDYNK